MIEQFVRADAQQLYRSLGQESGIDDRPEHEFGEVSGLVRRFDDRRHAGEERRSQLFQHAPHRKVEGVDLDRDTRPRGVDVLANECPCTAE
ncbi:Uncharacterised protein [Mycobacteroides abscessus subsp. abscessus]|nr:Uncharacterised protein [Mycobacteroides abscessus subsp. abscessus]